MTVELPQRYLRFLQERPHRRTFELLELVHAGLDGGGYPERAEVRAWVATLEARGLSIGSHEDVEPADLPSDRGTSLAAYAAHFESRPTLGRQHERRLAFALEIALVLLSRRLFATPYAHQRTVAALGESLVDERSRQLLFHFDLEGEWNDPKVLEGSRLLVAALSESDRQAKELSRQWLEAAPGERHRIRSHLEALLDGDAAVLAAANLDPGHVLRLTREVLQVDAERATSALETEMNRAAAPELGRRHRSVLACSSALVQGNLRCVGRVLRATSSAPIGPEELSQHILAGIRLASFKYSARKGYRFASYAVHWAIHLARRAGAVVGEVR